MIRRLALLVFLVRSSPVSLLAVAYTRIRVWGPMVIACAAVPAGASPIMSPADLRGHVALIDFEDVVTGGELLTDVADPLIIDDVTFTSLTGQLSILDITVSGWSADGTEVSGKTLFGGAEPDS